MGASLLAGSHECAQRGRAATKQPIGREKAQQEAQNRKLAGKVKPRSTRNTRSCGRRDRRARRRFELTTKDTARQSRNQIRISKSEIRNNSENPNAANSKPAADEATVLGCFLLHFRLFEFVSDFVLRI
jgi:hypothetical protein